MKDPQAPKPRYNITICFQQADEDFYMMATTTVTAEFTHFQDIFDKLRESYQRELAVQKALQSEQPSRQPETLAIFDPDVN